MTTDFILLDFNRFVSDNVLSDLIPEEDC